jgi:hypothetical protein
VRDDAPLWTVVVDYWTGEFTYGCYETEAAARNAMTECDPKWGTPRIRRDKR